MTDTTQDTASAAPVAATSAFTAFLATIKSDLQVGEQDVIIACQNIAADVKIVAEDLGYFIAWLGNHIGDLAGLVNIVQTSVTQLSTDGIAIPTQLTNGITAINQAVAGVNAALSNESVNTNASKALTDGYQAAKALQIAAAGAAAIASSLAATTAPTPAAAPAATAS